MTLSKGLIISAAGVIILFLQSLGLKINAPLVNEIIEAVCGILIILGLISATRPPKDGDNTKNTPPNDELPPPDQTDDNQIQ